MNETKEMDELERRSGVKEIGGGSEGVTGRKEEEKKGAWERKVEVKKCRKSEIFLKAEVRK